MSIIRSNLHNSLQNPILKYQVSTIIDGKSSKIMNTNIFQVIELGSPKENFNTCYSYVGI